MNTLGTTFSRLRKFCLLLIVLLALPMLAGAAGKSIVIGQAIDLSGANGALGRDYVAVFDGSLFGIRWPSSAVAGGAAPPGVTPFAPVTLTLPACADIAPADNKPKGSAVTSSGRRKRTTKIKFDHGCLPVHHNLTEWKWL